LTISEEIPFIKVKKELVVVEIQLECQHRLLLCQVIEDSLLQEQRVNNTNIKNPLRRVFYMLYYLYEKSFYTY
jgi:hypothetical protein